MTAVILWVGYVEIEAEACSGMYSWRLMYKEGIIQQGRCTSKEGAEAYGKDALKCFKERKVIQ